VLHAALTLPDRQRAGTVSAHGAAVARGPTHHPLRRPEFTAAVVVVYPSMIS
jgi:hypothetical protein